MLDCFESAGLSPADRPLLTHCQVLGDDLVTRMARNGSVTFVRFTKLNQNFPCHVGVIANVQPSFVPTDMRWVLERVTRPSQLQYSYAWKTLLEAGVVVAGGSDSPIENFNPFLGLYDAIYRRHREDETSIFRPEERLDFATALSLYTLNAAYAAGCENSLGNIAEGYGADLVLVDSRILEDFSLLQHVKPIAVFLGGINQLSDVGGSGASSGAAAESDDVPLCGTVGGPYIPGKNGLGRPDPLRCLCCLQV